MTVRILQIISEAHKVALLSGSQKQFGTIKLGYHLRGTVVLEMRTETRRQRDGSWKNLDGETRESKSHVIRGFN